MIILLVVLLIFFTSLAAYAKGRIDGHRSQILRGL